MLASSKFKNHFKELFNQLITVQTKSPFRGTGGYSIHPNLNESGINAKINGTIMENPTPNALTMFKYFLLCKPRVLNAL